MLLLWIWKNRILKGFKFNLLKSIPLKSLPTKFEQVRAKVLKGKWYFFGPNFTSGAVPFGTDFISYHCVSAVGFLRYPVLYAYTDSKSLTNIFFLKLLQD